MTDIDWSKAPEGAQYYSASADGFYTFYLNIKESTYEIFYCGGTRWILHVGTPEEHCTSIPRPPQAWNGEGLPPVGTVCEYQRNDVSYRQTWVKVTVKYISLSLVVLEHFAGKNEFVESRDSCVFRPIRTPEQIAADEREAAIKEMTEFSPVGRTGMSIDICSNLYDAGYRKPC